MYVYIYRYDVIRDRFGQDISDARMDEEEVISLTGLTVRIFMYNIVLQS